MNPPSKKIETSSAKKLNPTIGQDRWPYLVKERGTWICTYFNLETYDSIICISPQLWLLGAATAGRWPLLVILLRN